MTRRKASLNKIFVPTGNPQRLAAAVAAVEADAEAEERVVVADGEAGRGKTAASIWLAAAEPDRRLYIRGMQIWSASLTMLRALGEALGQPSMPSTTDRCFKAIRELIEATGRTTWILDEANYLRQHTLAILRDLHDVAGVSLVLVGERRITDELKKRQRLSSRIVARVPFVALSDDEAALVAGQLLPEGASIQPEAIKVLHAASRGLFRDYVSLLRLSLSMAAANDLSEIPVRAAEQAVRRRREAA